MGFSYEQEITPVHKKYSTLGPHATRSRETATNAIKPSKVGTGPSHTTKYDNNASMETQMKNIEKREFPNFQTIGTNFPYKERVDSLRQPNRRVVSQKPRLVPERGGGKFKLPTREACEEKGPILEPTKLFQ
jgi:hypothetical protein